MTNKQIQSFINKLNANTYHKTIFKHQISKDVDFAKVWESQKTKDILPFRFFFIKNKSNYVGAVLVMSRDLHWYITPEHRGKGYLSIALKNTILPYIFDVLEREEQYITITASQIGEVYFSSSCKVALNVGFKKVDTNNYLINAEDVSMPFISIDTVYKGLEDSKIELIKTELSAIAKRINQIDTQLENAFGYDIRDYTNTTLSDISSKLASHKFILEDIVQDFKEAKNNIK
ncbi:GNAT family N-acetyltransferase [Olleya sp. HaHaR_3_96]|uniref:GNAT family N-acetyltransferase n=1 Tax=Olleya sp. HaHaR_3_96 TaxID=2745560 RepID=UPI001C500A4C|nr:GNAT family N-acetyltransferase [Olleya sp. HaHaR_3_96]QXP59717.1 hypothetical protein H0I26_17685 [Olleya sp. HaHaR_3_96]